VKDKDLLRKLMRTRLPLNDRSNPHWVRLTRVMYGLRFGYLGWTVAHISKVTGVSKADVRRGLAEASEERRAAPSARPVQLVSYPVDVEDEG